MEIYLEHHKSFKWHNKENRIYFRGEFFYKGELYSLNKALDMLSLIKENRIVDYIKDFNGNFSIIIKYQDTIYAFSDKILSFSLFVGEHKGKLLIGDDANSIFSGNELDVLGLRELMSFGYCLNNRTIYKGGYLIGAGEYVIVSNNYYTIKKYYCHRHREIKDISKDAWLDRLDKTVGRTFDRFIERLRGRQVCLFLSGGYDSRLIALNLYKRGYKNVVCLSLKSENDKDVQVAKKISKQLGYKLIVFDFTQDFWRKESKKNEFWESVHSCSSGYVIYYPQGYVVLSLIKEGIIDKDAVIVTGNSGDLIEGNDVCMNFEQDKVYGVADIVKEIKKSHGINVSNNKVLQPLLDEEILKGVFSKDSYNFTEAQDLFEYFNWYERQCKYVTSDVRNYDILSGNEWALPLWDDEFVDFWLDLPINLRFKRKLYYEYVKADNLPTANKETLKLRFRSWLDCYAPWFINLLYPIRQIRGYLGTNILFSYHGVVSFNEWLYILWKTRGNKVKHISAISYKYFKKRFLFDIFNYIR